MATITVETIKDSETRQKILHQLLTEMALTDSLKIRDEQIAGFASRLRELYIPSFRHQYSKFFSMIVEIDKKMPVDGLEYLSANIIKVRMFVEHNCTSGDGTYKNLYKPLMKLSDHLNLEIARYNHFVGQNWRIMEQNKLLTVQNEQIKELKKQNQGLQKQLADATEKLDQANARFCQTEIKLTDVETKLGNAETKLANAETKLTDAEAKLKTIETDLPTATTTLNTLKKALIKVKKSLSSIHIDIIAVLGIFASIVLAFSGSMTILGSALTGMQEVHAFKATFFVLLCGFILGNVIFVMMHLVGKLTDRSIYVPCKTKQCSCENNKTPECRGLTRLRKRLPYIFWLNVILISLMFFDVVIWILENHFNFIR